MQLVSEIGLN